MCLACLKYLLVKSNLFCRLNSPFICLKLIDLIIVSLLLAFDSYRIIYVFLIALIVVVSAWAYGVEKVKFTLWMSLGIYFAYFLFYQLINGFSREQFFDLIVAYLFICLFVWLFMIIERQRTGYLNELIQVNHRLNKQVAESYTLQMLQSAISSILDTQELLETVNDIIIGIVGPTYSSIIQKEVGQMGNGEEEKLYFKLVATNMEEEKQRSFLENDCPILSTLLDTTDGIVGESGVGKDFSFISDERISCYIVVPLWVKEKKIGMIVVEHVVPFGVNEEHLRLIELVAGHVSIALENAALYERLQRMATLDGLTNVYNRMYFQKVIEEEFKKSSGKYPISIAICDADWFKQVNDQFGHIIGDKALSTLSSILQLNIRRGDILARYGGEEFVIIFPNTDLEQAYEIVERLRNKIEETSIHENHHIINITVSFGIATYPNHGDTTHIVLRAADDALYRAKKEGKNCTWKAG